MKRFALVLSALVCLMAIAALAACNKNDGTTKAKKTYELAVVTDVGQLMDGGFNQGTYEGVKEYAEKNGKTYKYYQPENGANATDNDRIAAMNLAIENGAKVIVTPGFLQETALKTVVPANPDVKFVFVDGWNMGYSNLTAISYKEQESGYLAGYAAVMDGYTKLGGVFGGAGGNPACNRFCWGYIQGINAAAAVKENVADIDVKISFNYGSSFSASTELQTMVSGWYSAGTQVVFSCGGSMVNSVIAAAGEVADAKIIGVDTDQSSLSDKIITSAFKGLNPSVQLVLAEYYAGKWDEKLADKTSNLGAAEDSTGLPTADASWRFTTFTKEAYATVLAGVKDGSVAISAETPAAASTAAAWTTALEGIAVNVAIIE